jgi:small subunit ribosomal protein S4
MHGANKRRKKVSEYGMQLQEKQKAKYTYGVLERQFRKTFDLARRKEGVTGLILMQLLESRLDNVVYRLGIAPTRAAARQLVNHRHIVVNGNVLDIPSYLVKIGDMVGVREKSKSLEVVTNALEGRNGSNFAWLEWDAEKMNGKFLNYPNREEIPENINEQLIVELYSK